MQLKIKKKFSDILHEDISDKELRIWSEWLLKISETATDEWMQFLTINVDSMLVFTEYMELVRDSKKKKELKCSSDCTCEVWKTKIFYTYIEKHKYRKQFSHIGLKINP